MGCIQRLRLLIGERPYPAQNEVDETQGIFNEPIMPSKNTNQRNNGKFSKESEEFSEENKRYQNKCNNVKNGKQNGFRGGLTTDTISTPKHNGKQTDSASQQQYFISNSSHVHVGPIYKQDVIINNFNGSDGECSRRISVEEIEAIRALQECDSPLTDEILEYVADEVGHRWRAMGRRLGYSNGRMDGFEINFDSQSERVFQLLLEWTQNKNEEATLATLSKKLWTVKAREVVVGLAKYIPGQPPN